MREQAIVKTGVWSLAFRLTLPVLTAYIPVGMVFGFLMEQAGFAWYWAPFASVIIYGGSLQFPMLSLYLAGAPMFSQVLTAASIASRNTFFGLSLVDRFKGSWRRKFYLAFGLVDATFSLLTTGPVLEGEEDDRYCLAVTLLPHLYWIGGTLLGSLIGLIVHFEIPGLEFVLTALFTTLAVEQYLKYQRISPFVLAAGALILAIALTPNYLMLTGILICATVLLIREAVT